MAPRFGRLALSFSASLGLVVGILATDPAAAARAFRFADRDPLVISTDTWPPEIEQVLLWNSSGRVRFLRARVTLFGLPREARATTLRVFGRVRLPPRGSAALEVLGNQGQTPEPGKYVGTLSVQEVPTGPVIHKRVELEVTEPSPPSNSPLVSEYAFTSYRSWFYFPEGRLSMDQARLPLDVKEADTPISPPPEGTVLGILLRSGGEGALEVSSMGETSEVIGGVPALDLSIDGSYDAGTYKGEVDLLPEDDEAGEATLTVVIKDRPFLPLLALALGVAAAWLIQRFIGVRARISRLRIQLARAIERIQEADDAFQKDVAARRFNLPSIAQRLKKSANEVDADLKAVEQSFFFVLDEQDQTYKGALSNMKTLDEQATVWKDFGKKLVALDDALNKVRDVGDRPERRPPSVDPTSPIRPALLKRAQEVLRPATVPDLGRTDLKTLPALAESVAKWTVLANAWVEVDAQLDDLEELAKRLRADAGQADRPSDPWTEEERKSLRSLDGLFSEARWDLWYAVDPGDFLARETERDMDRIEQSIARLSYHLRPEEEALREFLTAQPQMSFLIAPQPIGSRLKEREPRWRNLLADLKREPSEPAARASWLEQRIRTWTRVIFALLLVGAIYLGMQTVYVGKPFGTPLDYVGALTWGLASKLTLDAVASALDGVRRASLPLPRA
ncbi:MAG: hypothetical protein ACRDIX_05755 [Actinomycetota bacterium]